MKGRSNEEKEGFRSGKNQDWRDIWKEGFRTRWIQERRDTGKKGSMQEGYIKG